MMKNLLRLLGFEVAGEVYYKNGIVVTFDIVVRVEYKGKVKEFEYDEEDHNIASYDYGFVTSPFEKFNRCIIEKLIDAEGLYNTFNEYVDSDNYEKVLTAFALYEAGYRPDRYILEMGEEEIFDIDNYDDYICHFEGEVPYTEKECANYWHLYKGRTYHENYWYVYRTKKRIKIGVMDWIVQLLQDLKNLDEIAAENIEENKVIFEAMLNCKKEEVKVEEDYSDILPFC